MRLGATFAAARCGVEPVDALVLWDPCASGRSFLREQRALGLLVGARGAEDGGTSEMPGFDLSAGMTTEISGLDLLSDHGDSEAPGELACRVLLLTRGGRAPDRKLAGRFGQEHVEHREVSGQPELLEVQPPRQVVPTEAVVTVARWLDEVMPRDARPVTVDVPGAVTVAMRRQDPGSTDPAGGEVVAVRERGVSLGPVGLFGIEAAPANGGQSGPACILVSIANEHRIGPGRLWVKLSRQLAAGGFRCVRIDVDGFGDSPPRPGRQDQSEQSVHSVLGIDDILDAAQAVSPEEPGDVVLFGHSSSGYLILEAALELSPRGVCSVNPFLVFQPPEVAAGARIDDRRRFCLPRTAFADRAGDRRPGPLLAAAHRSALPDVELEAAQTGAQDDLVRAKDRGAVAEPPGRSPRGSDQGGDRRSADLWIRGVPALSGDRSPRSPPCRPGRAAADRGDPGARALAPAGEGPGDGQRAGPRSRVRPLPPGTGGLRAVGPRAKTTAAARLPSCSC